MSALKPEISMLIDTLDRAQPGDLGGWPTWAGMLDEKQAILARSGVGKVNTAALAALLWERYRPDTFIFTGVAGAIDPGLEVGDVVVAERTIQHDAGVVGPAGLQRYQAGHIPFFNPTDDFGYAPSKGLLTLAHEVARDLPLGDVLDRQPRVVGGTILTGDQFLTDATARDRLFADTGAQAIEMEGGAMAQVASRLGADHLVIRSLSDLAGEESVRDFNRFFPEVAANSASLVLALMRRL